MVISPSCGARRELCDDLSAAGICIDHETLTARGAARCIDDQIPVALIAPDADWHDFLTRLDPVPARPCTIVLLPDFDSSKWAVALQSGAFDALPEEAESDKILASVAAAFKRWQRRQLIRTALTENPMAGDEGVDVVHPPFD